MVGIFHRVDGGYPGTPKIPAGFYKGFALVGTQISTDLAQPHVPEGSSSSAPATPASLVFQGVRVYEDEIAELKEELEQ